MNKANYRWGLGVLLILFLLGGPLLYFLPGGKAEDTPRGRMPVYPHHTDHGALLDGPFPDGPSVTRACLECHPKAAREVMKTVHWTWEGEPVELPGRERPVRIGKKNLINNFCISVQSNWYGCTTCHAGYGWVDQNFDFTKEENVDCLVCHDQSGAYGKTKGGYPAPGVDLLAAARSVGLPTRANCGICHFRGGGGDAVKHGDLDGSLLYPSWEVDAHMGKYQMQCIDCHRTRNHRIAGRSISVSVDDADQIGCTDCHAAAPHRDERLDTHVRSVACQTCHVPAVALREPTKVFWDWSTAGQDRGETNPHQYLKIKGSFVYEKELTPEYYWFDGTADRYLMGDRIDPDRPTFINRPRGSIEDPKARIWPFKVHRGRQIYDVEHRYLLVPKMVGKGGYWTEFDWDKALRLGSQVTGLAYSGRYGFAPTVMYWPLTHMVEPREKALQCADCHAPGGRLDWKKLGYEGDPIEWGGRKVRTAGKGEGEEVR